MNDMKHAYAYWHDVQNDVMSSQQPPLHSRWQPFSETLQNFIIELESDKFSERQADTMTDQ